MNLVLVSGRYAEPESRLRADGEFARALCAAGCAVRWVTPVPDDGLADRAGEEPGLRVIPVRVSVPGFRSVSSRLIDRPIEREVAATIRAELPDIVHALDFGGSTSANIAWIADRLGVASVVSLDAAGTVCHRGDLVHASGSACTDWRSAERCATCCLVPAPGGLGRFGSAIGRLLRFARAPVNPFPAPGDFLDRTELILGGLQGARRIVVDSETARDQAASLGLRAELFEVLPGRDAAEWLRLYRSVASGSGGISS